MWEQKEPTTSVDKAYPCHHPPGSFLVPVHQISHLSHKMGASRSFFIRLPLNFVLPSDTACQLLTLIFEIWRLMKDHLSDCSIDG